MKVFNKYKNNLSVKNTDNPTFIDTNNQGDFLFLPLTKCLSKYNGIFYNNILSNNPETYKIISNFKLRSEPYALINNSFNFKRVYNNTGVETNDFDKLPFEEFEFVPYGLIYRVRNYSGIIDLHLDMRKIYDFDDKGRNYQIKQIKKDLIIIEYTKGNGWEIDYKLYLGIKGGNLHKVNDDWKEEFYPYDKTRKDFPFHTWIYNALSFQNDVNSDLIISFGEDEESVIKKIEFIEQSYYSIMANKSFKLNEFYEFKIQQNKSMVNRIIKKNENVDPYLAYISAKKSLFSLITDKGIYAGLPWFYQIWTRDESISFGALIQENKMLGFVKDRIIKYLQSVHEDGRMPNRLPHSDLASADGVGLVYKRLYDLINKVGDQLDVFFKPEELKWIFKVVENSLSNQLDNFGQDLLIKNDDLETWMDTGYNNDKRSGFRIEIQMLTLSTIKLLKFLAKHLEYEVCESYEKMYHSLKEKIKKLYFFGNILADGKGDLTIRPNIFLAYYIDKEILSNTEWEAVFDNAINKLWMNWGGFSTIQIDSEIYSSSHTGSDNRSYHRGDSWFFINHIGALCMLDLNKRKYKKYIEKVIDASAKEILSMGAIGSCTEISSAKELVSYGCFNQAWSNSTYIELYGKWKAL